MARLACAAAFTGAGHAGTPESSLHRHIQASLNAVGSAFGSPHCSCCQFLRSLACHWCFAPQSCKLP
eukprot:2503395-Amphidinium_carterae.2